QAGRALQKIRCAHTHAVVFDFDNQLGVRHPAAHVNAAAFDSRRKTVLDGIFDQRLQQHAGDHDVQGMRIEFFDYAQFVTAKADDFDVEVIVDELQFLVQRDKRIGAVQ